MQNKFCNWAHKFNTVVVFYLFLKYTRASQVAQMVNSLPAMQEAQVQSPDWEDPLEKGMATHFNG